ncbi:MAG: sigma-70 family RNA polymerase sigma factor [Clostridia bacterium]|nr:sigma-70 family RNA polymerase sigma factor [Clostridia bacterium]
MNALKFNDLLKRIKYDPNAVDEIYHEFYLSVKERVQFHFGNLVNPEDMAQEIFLKLTTMKTPKYVGAPATWMRKVTDNFVIDKLRASHVDLELLDSQPSDFDMDRSIIEADVQNAMSHLDEVSRTILYMHHWQKYKLYEVADELNMSYVNVRQIASRAYKVLEPYLKN